MICPRECSRSTWKECVFCWGWVSALSCLLGLFGLQCRSCSLFHHDLGYAVFKSLLHQVLLHIFWGNSYTWGYYNKKLYHSELGHLTINTDFGQVQVAYTCNLSYSGGRDRMITVGAQSRQKPILKKTLHKKGMMEWLKL
jgi:hypothetical protein